MSLPFVMGVAGHRAFTLNTSTEQDIRDVLRLIQNNAPETAAAGELVLLSSLAEGADRLVARIALEEGWRLVAVLPFEPAIFERDFPATVDEFRQLLRQASEVRVVPGCEYEAAALHVVRHAQVLLALWDGEPYTGKRGGTAHSVALRTRPEAGGGSLRQSGECLGPVYHVHLQRTQAEKRQSPKWMGTPAPDTGRLLPESVLDLLLLLDRINGTATRNRLSRVEVWQNNRLQLNTQSHSEARLIDTFADASLQSDESQRSALTSLKWSLAVLVGGSTLRVLFDLLHQATLGLVIYLLSLGLAIAFLYRVRGLTRRSSQDASQRHIEMRVLAELLRIGTALRLSGSTRSPTHLVPLHIWQESRWIPDAVRALWSTLPAPHVDAEYAQTTWIEGQVSQFIDKRIASIKKERATLERLLSRLFKGAVLLSVVMLVVSISPIAVSLRGNLLSALTTFNALFLLGVGAVGFYSQKRGLEEDQVRYQGMRQLYRLAQERWPGLEPAQRLELVEDLAQEAVTELATWMHTSRLKRPDLWR